MEQHQKRIRDTLHQWVSELHANRKKEWWDAGILSSIQDRKVSVLFSSFPQTWYYPPHHLQSVSVLSSSPLDLHSSPFSDQFQFLYSAIVYIWTPQPNPFLPLLSVFTPVLSLSLFSLPSLFSPSWLLLSLYHIWSLQLLFLLQSTVSVLIFPPCRPISRI